MTILQPICRGAFAAIALALCASSALRAVPAGPIAGVTVGEIKVLIVKVNLVGDTGPYPFTDRQFADNLAWNSERIKKFSYGLAWFAPARVAEVSIAMTPTQVCQGLGAAVLRIRTELDKQGVPHTDVAQVHFVLRGGTQCGWSGISSVGGRPTSTWFNGRYVDDNSLILHEGAHAMGGAHSTCEGITDGSACDFYSSLGSRHGEDFHYTPPEKEAFGWLNAPGAPAVQEISTDGRYTLDVYETPAGKLPKALKIRTGRASRLYAREVVYWISYKNGFIQVHEKFDGGGGNSIQRNANPGGEFDPLLAADKSFVIAPDNIRVTAVSLGAKSAIVAVDFDAPVAPPPPPRPAPPPPVGTNVALAKHGGVASASSVLGPAFDPSGAINGDRRGLAWGQGNGGWTDQTRSEWPDWLEVRFAGARPITEVHVFSVQDAAYGPADPSPAMTFSRYGLVDFDVQYWTGSAWQPVPEGAVRNNNLVWRRIAFPSITTDRVRIYVHRALDTWTRIVEVEVYGPDR